MKTCHALTLILLLPLFLIACNNPAEESTQADTGTKTYEGKGLEIRVLSDEIRRELGLEPDDLIGAVTSGGKTILYRATDREFEFAEKDLPPDLETINEISILITPAASPECKFFRDGFGNKLWYPKPPCPR